MTRVFVYGTLKRQGSNHRFLAGQKFLGEAQTTSGYILYSLGEYPGMVHSAHGAHFVTGEVWDVTDPALVRLDALEGLDEGLYTRVPIKLMPPFHTETVQTYVYLRSVEGRQILGTTWAI